MSLGGAPGDWFWAVGLVNSYLSERIFNHEFGHSIGLDHADEIQPNGSVTIDSHGAHPDLGVPINSYISFRFQTGFDQNLTPSEDPYLTPIRDTVHIHHPARTTHSLATSIAHSRSVTFTPPTTARSRS